MNELLKLNEIYKSKLHAIWQLDLDQWVALAKSLNVDLNNREHAAKKLAIREMKGVL